MGLWSWLKSICKTDATDNARTHPENNNKHSTSKRQEPTNNKSFGSSTSQTVTTNKCASNTSNSNMATNINGNMPNSSVVETIDGVTWHKTSVQPRYTNFPHCAVVDGKPVAIFQSKKTHRLHVIDNNCYHAGGSLSGAKDIEEIAGEECVRCPLHKFVISIETGHTFLQDVTFEKKDGRMKPIVGDWSSKGQKQRVHKYKIDRSGYVWIALDKSGDYVPSDEFCKMRVMN